MNFLTANINSAIVRTQYDLRGFTHPLGFREDYKLSPKSLDATTYNFIVFATGCSRGRTRSSEYFSGYFESYYEDYLTLCRHLAKNCDPFQKEAIQLIVQEIVKQSEEMKSEVIAGKREDSAYFKLLDKSNRWDKIVSALAEVFEVKLEFAIA
jgi:hypothetical protein